MEFALFRKYYIQAYPSLATFVSTLSSLYRDVSTFFLENPSFICKAKKLCIHTIAPT